jgi:hypothetical protein
LESLDEEFYVEQFGQLKLEIQNLIMANSSDCIIGKWKSNKYDYILEDLKYNVNLILKDIQNKDNLLGSSALFERFERYASDVRKARFEIYGAEKLNNEQAYGWGPNDEEYNEEYYYGYDEETYYEGGECYWPEEEAYAHEEMGGATN